MILILVLIRHHPKILILTWIFGIVHHNFQYYYASEDIIRLYVEFGFDCALKQLILCVKEIFVAY